LPFVLSYLIEGAIITSGLLSSDGLPDEWPILSPNTAARSVAALFPELLPMRAFSVLAFVFAAGFSQAALAAPPKLMDSKPAEGALATRPGVMQLSFDQPVDASSAAYEVLMMTMPGMTM
jgi:hypothetical protein